MAAPPTMDAKTDRWLDQGANTTPSSKKGNTGVGQGAPVSGVATLEDLLQLATGLERDLQKEKTDADTASASLDEKVTAATDSASTAGDAATTASNTVTSAPNAPAQAPTGVGGQEDYDAAKAATVKFQEHQTAVDQALGVTQQQDESAQAAEETATQASEDGKKLCDDIKEHANAGGRLAARISRVQRQAQTVLAQKRQELADKKDELKKQERLAAQIDQKVPAANSTKQALDALHDSAFQRTKTIADHVTAIGEKRTEIGTHVKTLEDASTETAQALVTAQTAEETAKKALDEELGTIGVDQKLKWTSPELKIPINKSCGMIDLSEIVAVLECEGTKPGGGKSNTKVSVSQSNKELEVAVENEAKTLLLGKEVTVKTKAGATVSYESATVGLEATFDGLFASGSPSLGFAIVGVDWNDNDVTFAELTLKWTDVPVKVGNLLGYDVEVKASIAIKADPNWTRIASWFAEKYGTQAAAAVALDASIVLAGIATLAVPIVAILTKDEIPNRADAANALLKKECAAYKAVMTGGSGSGPGATLANAVIAKAKVPKPEFVAAAKTRSLDAEAKAAVAPVVREKAIAAYWEEHYVEKWVSGGKGSFNFNQFKRVLDAALR